MFGAIDDAATLAPVTTTTKQSAWDVINKGLNVLQTGANIYTQVKTGSNTSPGFNPALTTTQIQPGTQINPPAPVDNTKKYLLIGGLGVLAVGGIYLATRKKKK